MSEDAFGRELRCSYNDWHPTAWFRHQYCLIDSVDFSMQFKSEKHTFSGSSSDKSETKTLYVSSSSKIEFFPTDMFTEFRKLTGLFVHTGNLPTIKSELFPAELSKIEYLYLGFCKTQTVEENAFEQLKNLSWISLEFNELTALPLRIFKHNPELAYVNFRFNKIHAVVSDFFAGLEDLKFVRFEGNQCISKSIGCDGCSVSKAALYTDLITCFQQTSIENLKNELGLLNATVHKRMQDKCELKCNFKQELAALTGEFIKFLI